jgi:hypothetical protein
VRHWTEDEARAELPRLRVLIDALRRGAHQSTMAQTNGHGQVTGAQVAGATQTEAAGEPPVDTVDVQTALDELRDKEIVLRDADSGLLDFPAVTAKGVVYLLCWKRDEDDLAWWHFAEEGFAGRKPLPVPPDL